MEKKFKKEPKERFTSYLPKGLIAELRELSDQTRVPQSAFVEEAIKDLIWKYSTRFKT